MSGLGLESLMEGWSLNEGSGSLKKGSSMNAMRSARGDMGTPGGKLGGGIKSSSHAHHVHVDAAADATDPFFGMMTGGGGDRSANPSGGINGAPDVLGISSSNGPTAGVNSGGGCFDDIFGLGTNTTAATTTTPMRQTSASIPIATSGAPPASDFFSSPVAHSIGSPLKNSSAGGGAASFSASPAKKKSGSVSDPFGGMDDLLGLGVGGGSLRGSMSGAPMAASRVDSLDDLFGGSGGSSGPASSSAQGGSGGRGVGGGDDVDLLGALFGPGTGPSTLGPSSRVSSTSTLGGGNSNQGDVGGGGASSPRVAVDGLDNLSNLAKNSASSSGYALQHTYAAAADDLLGDLLGGGGGESGGSGASSLRVPSPVPDFTREDVAARSRAGAALEPELGIEDGTIGAAVARAEERAAARSPPTGAAPIVDGFAGFEDFVTSSDISAGEATANKDRTNVQGASVGGGRSGSGGALDSLEDLFNVSTAAGTSSGGQVAKGTGLSLGDDLDAVFGAPSTTSMKYGAGGSSGAPPVVIDDMFGPAMGAAFSGAGGAGVIGSQVTADEIVYQPDDEDEDLEGDTEHRKELRRQRHERNRARIASKLQEKRDREAAAMAEQAERQVIKDLIGADIDEWLRANQGNIRTMLANLGDVLWEGHTYKSPGLNDLVSPAAVRKSYHKALVIIHPDKVRQRGGDTSMIYIADKVFDQVRDAFKAMEQKEL